MKLYVIRHTETLSNVNYTIAGRTDEHLTEKGIEQAALLREKLENIDYDLIIASPLLSAKETAQIINYKNIPIIFDERIIERDPGSLVSKSRTLINRDEWNSLEFERTKENSETLLSLNKRVKNILDELEREHPDKTIIFVTHNSISRAIWMLKCSDDVTKEGVFAYYQNCKDIIVYED